MWRTPQYFILTFVIWRGGIGEFCSSMEKGVAHRAFLGFTQTDVPDCGAFRTLGQCALSCAGWAAAGSPWQILSSVAMTMGSLYLGIAGLTFLTYGWFMRSRSGASIMESRGYT